MQAYDIGSLALKKDELYKYRKLIFFAKIRKIVLLQSVYIYDDATGEWTDDGEIDDLPVSLK